MMRFSFLLAVDEQWTRRHLVPLLIKPPVSDDYQAAWDGLLYGRLTLETVDVLSDPFLVAAGNVRHFQASHSREQFVAYLVGLLIDVVEDPLEAWIPQFLPSAEAEDRQQFAFAIWRRLSEMSDGEQRALWERWLKRYWEGRINGVPVTLQGVEVQWMLNCLPEFHGVFTEAVQLATPMPVQSVETGFLLRALEEGDHCEREPNAVADLLLHLPEASSGGLALFRWPTLIERLLQSDLDSSRRELIEDLRLRLGLAKNSQQD